MANLGIRLFCTLALVAAAPLPVHADVIRVGLTSIDTSFSLVHERSWVSNFGHGLIATHDLTLEVGASDLAMPTLSWERRFDGPWAVALSVASDDLELNYDWTLVNVSYFPPDQPPTTTELSEAGRFASSRLTFALVDLRYHLFERPRLDLYAGVTAGRVFASSPRTEFHFSQAEIGFDTVEIDDAIALGVHLGTDIPIGSRGLVAGILIRGLRADLDVHAFRQTQKLELELVSAEVGLGWRW